MKAWLLIIFAILSVIAAACAANDLRAPNAANDSDGQSEEAASALKPETEPRHAVCIAGKTLKGCCSWNTGIKGITRDGLLCMNDAYSPTCSAEINQLLNGCCSGNGGFGYVRTGDGGVICRNDRQSPSCKIAYQACSNDNST